MITIKTERNHFSEVLIIPVVQDDNLEAGIIKMAGDLNLPVDLLTEQIKAEKKEISLFYPVGQNNLKKVYCLGLGRKSHY